MGNINIKSIQLGIDIGFSNHIIEKYSKWSFGLYAGVSLVFLELKKEGNRSYEKIFLNQLNKSMAYYWRKLNYNSSNKITSPETVLKKKSLFNLYRQEKKDMFMEWMKELHFYKMQNSLTQLREFIRLGTLKEQDEFFHLLYETELFKKITKNSVLEEKDNFLKEKNEKIIEQISKNHFQQENNQQQIRSLEIMELELGKVTEEIRVGAEHILTMGEKRKRYLTLKQQQIQENKLVLEKKHKTAIVLLEQLEHKKKSDFVTENMKIKVSEAKHNLHQTEKEIYYLEIENRHLENTKENIDKVQQYIWNILSIRQKQESSHLTELKTLKGLQKDIMKEKQRLFPFIKRNSFFFTNIRRRELWNKYQIRIEKEKKEIGYWKHKKQNKEGLLFTRQQFFQIIQKGTIEEKETLLLGLMDRFSDREEQGTRKNKTAKKFAVYLDKQNVKERKKLIETFRMSAMLSLTELKKRLMEREELREKVQEKEYESLTEERKLEMLLYSMTELEFRQLENEIRQIMVEKNQWFFQREAPIEINKFPQNSPNSFFAFWKKNKKHTKQHFNEYSFHSLFQNQGDTMLFQEETLSFLHSAGFYKRNIIVDILKKGTLREQEEFIQFIKDKNVFTTMKITVPNLVNVLQKGNIDQVRQMGNVLREKRESNHVNQNEQKEFYKNQNQLMRYDNEKDQVKNNKVTSLQEQRIKVMLQKIEEQDKKIDLLERSQKKVTQKDSEILLSITKHVIKEIKEELELEQRRRGFL